MPDLRDHTAVVTGASSGIGMAMARILASWGADVIISARRLHRLETLAQEIRSQHGVQVTPIRADLADPAGPDKLWTAVQDTPRQADRRPVDIWINNAGGGPYENYVATTWERQAAVLQLNVMSLAELSYRFVQQAVSSRDRRAYLLNISSIGAYFSVQHFANYSAAKAYVRNFTEGLAAELAGTHVSATCVCPGGTQTEFFEQSGQRLPWLSRHTAIMSPERCATIALKAMLAGRRNIVTGLLNSIICWSARGLPRRLATSVAPLLLGKPASPENLLTDRKDSP